MPITATKRQATHVNSLFFHTLSSCQATPTAPTKDEADQLREKANFALEQAISKDEQKQLAQALPLYTEAVELFMAGCSATRDVEKQASMKRMACQVTKTRNLPHAVGAAVVTSVPPLLRAGTGACRGNKEGTGSCPSACSHGYH